MRLRNVHYAKDLILKHPEYIRNIPRGTSKNLFELFDNKKPLCLEIGAGKGQFIHNLAQQKPHVNFLAIEQFDSVIVRALEKQLDDPLDNVLLARMDAADLGGCLPKGSVSTIYLNFSDPWPKARHEKRRLSAPGYLDLYRYLLKPEGTIELKTDNRGFFEYSLKSIIDHGLDILDINLDLHQDEPEDNIMTEFEEKFKHEGPIYKLSATFKEA